MDQVRQEINHLAESGGSKSFGWKILRSKLFEIQQFTAADQRHKSLQTKDLTH
jgi:hypothetical protein